MNTQVNIIAAIILIMIFLPIYFLNKTGITFSKKLIKSFNSIALSNNLNLDLQECWANTCIGIDINQKKLIYKRGLDSDAFTIINLKEINTCELIKNVSQRRVDKTVVNELNTLDLKLSAKNNYPSNILNFYDKEIGFNEDFELKRIDKWMTIIKANLTTEGFKKVA